jgi:hypothetical protein
MSILTNGIDWRAFDRAFPDLPEPCAEAVDFAAMLELAGRLGMDWTEAAQGVSDNATEYENEADDAREQMAALSDDALLRMVGKIIAANRADHAAALMRLTARDVMVSL